MSSRFTIAEKIKEEANREEEQKKLRRKHSITEENVIIIEKSNIYKFTIHLLITAIKTIASLVLFILAFVGLATLAYPQIRQELLLVLIDVVNQLQHMLKI